MEACWFWLRGTHKWTCLAYYGRRCEARASRPPRRNTKEATCSAPDLWHAPITRIQKSTRHILSNLSTVLTVPLEILRHTEHQHSKSTAARPIKPSGGFHSLLRENIFLTKAQQCIEAGDNSFLTLTQITPIS